MTYPHQYITADEAAAVVGVSRSTAYDLAGAKAILSFKDETGRWRFEKNSAHAYARHRAKRFSPRPQEPKPAPPPGTSTGAAARLLSVKRDVIRNLCQAGVIRNTTFKGRLFVNEDDICFLGEVFNSLRKRAPRA